MKRSLNTDDCLEYPLTTEGRSQKYSMQEDEDEELWRR